MAARRNPPVAAAPELVSHDFVLRRHSALPLCGQCRMLSANPSRGGGWQQLAYAQWRERACLIVSDVGASREPIH